MTYAELYTSLTSTNIPVGYNKMPVQSLPAIVYSFRATDNIIADNKIYQRQDTMQVDLYTAGKDIATEDKLEAVLDGLGLIYSKDETADETERFIQLHYEFNILR